MAPLFYALSILVLLREADMLEAREDGQGFVAAYLDDNTICNDHLIAFNKLKYIIEHADNGDKTVALLGQCDTSVVAESRKAKYIALLDTACTDTVLVHPSNAISMSSVHYGVRLLGGPIGTVDF